MAKLELQIDFQTINTKAATNCEQLPLDEPMSRLSPNLVFTNRLSKKLSRLFPNLIFTNRLSKGSCWTKKESEGNSTFRKIVIVFCEYMH